MSKVSKGSLQRISHILPWIFAFSFSQGQDVDWPSGSYGFPKPKSGCPNSKTSVWSEGWRLQDMEDRALVSRSRLSKNSHFDNEIIGNKNDVNRTFCMKQNSSGVGTDSWPNGEYCIYKSGIEACPKNMSSGWVKWDDEDNSNINKRGGSLPQGVYNQDTKIYYCCQTNGKWYDSIELPVNQPFYLLTSNSVDTPKCQMVKWATSRLEYVVFDTNHQDNADSEAGDHVFIKYRRKIYYCYYEGCRRTMTNVSSGSFRSYPAPVTEMDPRSQYCSWLITIPETSVITLSFSELTILNCDDTFLRIYDGADGKAPLLGSYCGSNASKQVQISSSTNSLYVVANSGMIGRRDFSFQAYYNGSLKDSGVRRTAVPSVTEMNPYSQYCSWVITIPATSVVFLSFSELTIPSCDDTFLRIYVGVNGKAPLLGSYCGSNASTQIEITSSTNSLYFVANFGIYGRSEDDDIFLRIYDGANQEAPLFGTYCESRSNAGTQVNITSSRNTVYLEANFGRHGTNGSQAFSFRALYSGILQDSVNEDRSHSLNKLVITLPIVGLALLLILVIIVVLVKYKRMRRNAEPKLVVASVNIALETVENSEVVQESNAEMSTENHENAPVHSDKVEDSVNEGVSLHSHSSYADVVAANKNTKSCDGVYTELDLSKREKENDYQALVKLAADKNTKSCDGVYTELDLSKREKENDNYQALVKLAADKNTKSCDGVYTELDLSKREKENDYQALVKLAADKNTKSCDGVYTELDLSKREKKNDYQALVNLSMQYSRIYRGIDTMSKVTKGSLQRISHILLWIFVLSFSQGQDVDWPSGSYGLPKPKSGCPNKTSVWSEGWRFQDMEDSPSVSRSRLSNNSHFDNEIIGYRNDIKRTFCMKQNSSGVGTDSALWPNGEYCIYKSGIGACPKNMSSGWVKWDDEDYRNQNKRGGSLPQGVYNQDTKIYYCCRTNGKWYDSIELPVNQPFYLLTSNSVDTPKCQMVKWATSRLEYVVFDTNHQQNNNSEAGDHVFIENRRKIYYCYYEGCRRTMTNASSGSFRSYPAPVTEMDPRSQYCSWLITIPETSVISLNFSEITIPSCDDMFLRIYDGANGKAPLLGSYCGSNANKQVKIFSSTNSLYVVANSGMIGRQNFSFQAHYYNGSLKDLGVRPTTVSSSPFTPITEMNPYSQYCSWVITIPATSVVSLTFSEMTIPSCDDTFLRIYDGTNGKAPLLGSYCGSNASTQIEITSSTNSLYFVANSEINGRSEDDDIFLRIYDGANKEFPLFGTYCDSRSNASTEVVNITSSGNAVYLEANFGRHGKNGSQVFSFRALYSESFKDSDRSRSLNKLVIILSIAGLALVLILVIIVVLVIYKRRNAEPKSVVAPVSIPLEKVENSEVVQESNVEMSTENLENAPIHSGQVEDGAYERESLHSHSSYVDVVAADANTESCDGVYTKLDLSKREKENDYEALSKLV
ncbi:uncharacterized protein LOC114523247 [Dendronephthya gigantea]|uniref:uncharacterized protein LOC114523247 n=1 Tax=Dendronephthya gigantea TaxID=151771 RepID=UPI00106C749E|nr:uncharacterized protein LOC114523247 [Dendronephthya gigantea]